MAVETQQQHDLNSLRIHRETTTTSRPSRSKQTLIWIAAAVVAVALIGFAASSLLSSPEEVQAGTVAMTLPSQANSVLTASGYVVASRKAAVSSKGTGRLIWLGVEEGSHVQHDQVIGRIEAIDVQASLEQAQASLAAAHATLDNYQAALVNADSNYRRQKFLYGKQLAASADLVSAEAAFKQAQSQVAAQEANIHVAERTVQAAQVQVEFTNIRAPFNGTVLTKDADVGDVITPFGAAAGSRGDVVTLADMTSLDAEVDVAESNLENVHVGQPCQISLDAVPEKQYRGVVHMIVPTADRSKATVLTKVNFLDRDDRVLPEMSLKVQFLKDSAEVDSSGPKLTVPASAVVTKNSRKIVYVIDGDHLIETPVTLGAAIGNGIEVKAGIKNGDKVVLSPADKLKNGTKVKVAS